MKRRCDISHPHFHARSSARKYGGEPIDYLHIHVWFDSTKAHLADSRHRLILHNSFGIFLCEQVHGVTFTRKSDGKEMPTRLIGEQHVLEDYGKIPTLEECLRTTTLEKWMTRGAVQLSQQEDES